MELLKTLFILYLILEGLSILFYLPRMKYWFEGLKKQKHLVNGTKNKFGVIIAAKNESKIIAPLFDSINNQTYDLNKFDVHIIVDNIEDPTIQIAKIIKANCYAHIVKNQKRKADALDGCFKYILAHKEFHYDAYLIVDADNIMTPNYIEEMNNAMVSEADIVIARKRIKNWESNNKKNRNFISNCSAMTYTGLDAMGNKARSKRGYVPNICGQGMLIKKNIIDAMGGYTYRSLIEDYEIGVDCAIKNYKAIYYEYAEIYSEEPVSHKVFNQRRMRWIRGYVQCNKMYRKEIKNTMKCKNEKKRNHDFLYAIVPVCFMFAFSGCAFAGFFISSLVLRFAGLLGISIFAFVLSLIVLGIMYLELAFYMFLSVIQDRDINKMTTMEKLKLVVFSPFILLEYGIIYIKALLTSNSYDWVPIERIEM